MTDATYVFTFEQNILENIYIIYTVHHLNYINANYNRKENYKYM